MIVLCDNSTLSALAELGWLDLISTLHSRVSITRSVLSEGLHPNAPAPLRVWLQSPPDWLEVLEDPLECLLEVSGLGRGEASSITLAWEHRGESFLILDDGAARALVKALGLPMTGLLGLLVRAASMNLIDFATVPKRLKSIGFRISDSLISQALNSLAGKESNPG